MDTVRKEHYLQRQKNVLSLLKSYSVSTLLVHDPVDLYYLTGLTLSKGYLLLGDTTSLFVDGRYVEQAKNHSVCDTYLLTKEGLPLTNLQTLGILAEKTTYQEALAWQKQTQLIPLKDLVQQVRAIKEPEELQRLKKAQSITLEGMQFVETALQEGITEKELSIKIKQFFLTKGIEELAFEPIVAFGKNSQHPHYAPQLTPLKQGDVVQVDFGVKWEGYCSDASRLFFFGPKDPLLSALFACVEEALQATVSLCRPGVLFADVDKKAREVIEKAGYQDYFPHSVGHGVGLCIHELPSVKESVLEEGMVFTLEPGIYVPNKGGVRLENLYRLHEGACILC